MWYKRRGKERRKHVESAIATRKTHQGGSKSHKEDTIKEGVMSGTMKGGGEKESGEEET